MWHFNIFSGSYRYRFLLLISIFFLFPTEIRSQILLNEVYYDHPGADAGYEFIEIINTTTAAASLFGCSLEFHNGASDGWTLLWAASLEDSIEPGGLRTIGGANVSPLPDDIVELGLQNGPDAVRITRNGSQADLLGYGMTAGGAYCEGESAGPAPPGFSLGRKPDGVDTDDNRSDFEILLPSPGMLNIPKKDLRPSLLRPFRKTAEPGRGFSQAFYIHNDGIEFAAKDDYRVNVMDSIDGDIKLLFSTASAGGIDAADSLLLEPEIFLSAGYHLIRISVEMQGDERSGNNSLLFAVRSGIPKLLISEVMSYPRSGSPQYVELFNAGREDIDISGWMLRDSAHSYSLITSLQIYIPPGSYAVITKDKDGLVRGFASLEPESAVQMEGSWPVFNHSGGGTVADSVCLADYMALAVDETAYPSQEQDTQGKSLERGDLFAGRRPHAWYLSSSAEGGSPGRGNGFAIVQPAPGRGITLHPNPFSPYAGEKLAIEIARAAGAGRAVVSVYDINGIKVNDIGSTDYLPNVFFWDGRSNDGSIAGSGIYILACEIFDDYGRKLRTERVVVGCGRRKH